MRGQAEINALQKLCLIAEQKRWRVRLTLRAPEKGNSELEDLIVEDKSGTVVAAEPLYNRDVVEAAHEILVALKLAA